MSNYPFTHEVINYEEPNHPIEADILETDEFLERSEYEDLRIDPALTEIEKEYITAHRGRSLRIHDHSVQNLRQAMESNIFIALHRAKTQKAQDLEYAEDSPQATVAPMEELSEVTPPMKDFEQQVAELAAREGLDPQATLQNMEALFASFSLSTEALSEDYGLSTDELIVALMGPAHTYEHDSRSIDKLDLEGATWEGLANVLALRLIEKDPADGPKAVEAFKTLAEKATLYSEDSVGILSGAQDKRIANRSLPDMYDVEQNAWQNAGRYFQRLTTLTEVPTNKHQVGRHNWSLRVPIVEQDLQIHSDMSEGQMVATLLASAINLDNTLENRRELGRKKS